MISGGKLYSVGWRRGSLDFGLKTLALSEFFCKLFSRSFTEVETGTGNLLIRRADLWSVHTSHMMVLRPYSPISSVHYGAIYTTTASDGAAIDE